MSARASVADGLAQLDARSWAQLLRALRSLTGTTDALAGALATPSGELSAGPARRALCDALAGDGKALERLRADTSLPVAVRDVIGASAAPVPGDAEDAAQGDVPGGHTAGARAGAEGRAEARARTLRRTVDEERRRREGAEARAAAAHAREDALRSELATLARALEVQQAELAEARGGVDQALARAERRAAVRIAALEEDLTVERRTSEDLRRELDRARADLAVVLQEVGRLRADAAARIPARPAGGASGRPLALPADVDEGTTAAARWLAERASVVLVDGYNATLLLRPGHDLEAQRRWLVDRVRPLAVRGPARPVVVFDGAGASATMRDTGGVEVRFTVEGATADDEIVFAVAATDEPVLVVTDDVDLQRRVRAEGGNVVGVVHLAGIVDA